MIDDFKMMLQERYGPPYTRFALLRVIVYISCAHHGSLQSGHRTTLCHVAEGLEEKMGAFSYWFNAHVQGAHLPAILQDD